MSDLIDRQAAIDALDATITITGERNALEVSDYIKTVKERLEELPSVEPKTAIPLSWIEGQIKWLKSLDNAFTNLTAIQISSMVKKWKDEQNERFNQ